jgi:hypothetical protein
MTNTSSLAWWAEPGPDTCSYCEINYYAEHGYYCEVCDEPICISCVSRDFETGQTRCPGCEQADKAAEND